MIITGDINNNTLSENVSDLGISVNYLYLLAELDRKSTITKPTRGDSCLDHDHVSFKHQATSVIYKTDVTDHNMIFTCIQSTTSKPVQKIASCY